MCGLFGFSKSTDLTRSMTPVLAAYMAGRGEDSWGVTDGTQVYKDANSILKTFIECGFDRPTYHTRGASVGAITKDNAHPFTHTSANRTVIGVHNGHIDNYKELNKQYKRNFEVDSEHIFAHLAQRHALTELTGRGVIVWYEQEGNALPRRYLSTSNSTALHIVQLATGEFAFASTRSCLQVAAQLCGAKITTYVEPLKGKHKYELTDTSVVDCGPFEWGSTPLNVTSHARQTTVYSGGICAMRGCFRMAQENLLMCTHCHERNVQAVLGTGTTLVKPTNKWSAYLN